MTGISVPPQVSRSAYCADGGHVQAECWRLFRSGGISLATNRNRRSGIVRLSAMVALGRRTLPSVPTRAGIPRRPPHERLPSPAHAHARHGFSAPPTRSLKMRRLVGPPMGLLQRALSGYATPLGFEVRNDVEALQVRSMCWCGRPLIPTVLWRSRRHR
jgi:hypothetical protein